MATMLFHIYIEGKLSLSFLKDLQFWKTNECSTKILSSFLVSLLKQLGQEKLVEEFTNTQQSFASILHSNLENEEKKLEWLRKNVLFLFLFIFFISKIYFQFL